MGISSVPFAHASELQQPTVLNQKVSNNDNSNNKNIKTAIARIVIVMMMERTIIIRIV